MQHVDEGALHAYLDGALGALPASEAAHIRRHLASCEACARRLEEERALRAEAEAILAGADPGAAGMAPLEELRRLALARTRTDAGVRLRRLTWAASLVLAVGAGWMLRGAQAPRFSEALSPSVRGPRQDREAEAAPGTSPGADLRAAAETGAGTAPQAGGSSGRDRPASVDEVAGAPTPAAPSGSGANEARQAAPVPAPVETQPARPVPVSPDEADAKLAEPPPAVLVRQAVSDSFRRALAEGRAQAALVLADSAREPVSASITEVSGVRAAAAKGELFRAREMPRAVEPEMAMRRADRDLDKLAVPGLAVLRLDAGEGGLPEGTLRVLQLLDPDTLELLHLPAGADPASVAPPHDGRVQVAVRYGAGWLVGRARMSREALEQLLARVTGGG